LNRSIRRCASGRTGAAGEQVQPAASGGQNLRVEQTKRQFTRRSVERQYRRKTMEHFTGPRGDHDAFGNGTNTQAHRINKAMTTTPQTLKQISEKSNVENLDRIRHHMRWLAERGFAGQNEASWALTEKAFCKFQEKRFPLSKSGM